MPRPAAGRPRADPAPRRFDGLLPRACSNFARPGRDEVPHARLRLDGRGLVTTALVAWLTLSTPALLQLVFGNRLVFYGLMIGELGLVAWLSGLVGRMSASTAALVFLGYSALNGLTLSCIFLVYTSSSIASTFLITAGTFGAMSVYGLVTSRPLDGLGSFAFMGLIGVILAKRREPLPAQLDARIRHQLRGRDRLRRADGLRHPKAEDDGGAGRRRTRRPGERGRSRGRSRSTSTSSTSS